MKKLLPLFLLLLISCLEGFSQKIYIAEESLDRVRIGNLNTNGISSLVGYLSLNSPQFVEVDQINNRFYYQETANDLYAANLTTGALQSTVITTGAMDEIYDMVFSDNAGGLFVVNSSEVDGVRFIPWDNNDAGADYTLPIAPYQNEIFNSVAVDEGNEFVYYAADYSTGYIIRSNFNGSGVTVVTQVEEPVHIAYDKINNDLYIVNSTGTLYNLYQYDCDNGTLNQLFTLSNQYVTDLQVYPGFGKVYYGIENTGIYSVNMNGIGSPVQELALPGSGRIHFSILADVAPPIFTDLEPENDATNVSLSGNLVMTFNENVKFSSTTASSEEMELRIVRSDGMVVETIERGDSRISITNNTVTINPGSTFSLNSTYYVLIGANFFSDLSSNDFIGITSSAGWEFTTSGGVTITAPTAVACVGTYKSYPNIVIRESDVGNFKTSSSRTLVFGFPNALYTFENTIGSIAVTSGSDISGLSIAITNTTLTISYTANAESSIDEITISGLKFRSTNSANAQTPVERTGGTGVVDGLVIGTVIANVTTQAQPAPPTIATPDGSSICQNGDATSLTVNATGTFIRWFTANDLLPASQLTDIDDVNDVTASSLNIPTASTGVVTRYVRQNVAGCISLALPFDITIMEAPTAVTLASTSRTSCATANGTATVTDVDGDGTTGYTIEWYVDGDEVSPIATGPSITGRAEGIYNVLVENPSGCFSPTVPVTILDERAFPVSTFSPVPNTSCDAPNGEITATVTDQIGPITDYTFTWRDGPDPDSDPLGPVTPTISGIPAGSYGVTIRHIPSQCEIFFGTSVLENVTPPTFNSPSGLLCETIAGAGTAAVTFSSYDATITGGDGDLSVSWFDAALNSVTSATVNNGELFNYTLASTTTGCDVKDEMTFTIEAQPTVAQAGTNIIVCGNSTPLSGNVPVVGSGAWTIVSGLGGNVMSPTNPASAFTGTPGATYELQWTISNGICTPRQDLVSVTFEATPTAASAGSDQTVCSAGFSLNASTPSVGSGLWTVVSGSNGVFGDDSSPASSFSGVAGSSYTLRWTVSNGSCAPSFDEVNISLTAPPTTATAGTDQGLCGNSVTLGGNTPVVGTGLWSILAGSGGTVADPTNPSSSFTGNGNTPYTLRWTVANSPCSASADDVVITFSEPPTVSIAGPDQELCSTSLTLAGNSPTVGTGLWTVVSGTNGIFSNNALATTSFSGTAGNDYVLRWTISNGGCTVSSDDVAISFVAPPTPAAAGNGLNICGATGNLAGNTPSTGTGLWTIISGSNGVINSPGNPTSAFTGTPGANYVLRWTTSNGICPPSSDDIAITLINTPTVAQAGQDREVCATSTALSANTPTSGTGSWSIVNGTGGSVITPSNSTSQFQGVPGNTYVLRWTIAQTGCTSSVDEVTIALKVLPQGSGSLSPLTALCTEDETTITVNGVNHATSYDWSMPPGIEILSTSDASAVIRAVSGSGGNISVIPQNECGNGPTVNASLTVLPIPSIEINLPATPYPDDEVSFSITSNATLESVLWNFGDGGTSTDQSPSYSFINQGDYGITLNVKSTNGCENSDAKTLTVSDEPSLSDYAIKNVITANGDDQNKFLFIENLDRHPDNEVRFVDRWGVEIINLKNYQNDWEAKGNDGQFLPAGQYICIVKLNDSGKIISRTVSIIKGR